MQVRNESMHVEVSKLTAELEEQRTRLEAEGTHLRSSIRDLEQQLQAVARGYEQVERQSEELSIDNAKLRGKIQINENGPEWEAAAARAQVDELRREKADLVEVLGHICTACPVA